jgi:hypothetical protein
MSAAGDAGSLNAIAGMFAAIFEGELGDAGFVEVAEALAIMQSYCSLVARERGKSRPRLRARSSAILVSLAARTGSRIEENRLLCDLRKCRGAWHSAGWRVATPGCTTS